MKQKKTTLSGKIFFSGMITAFAVLVFFSSCKKGPVKTVYEADMVEAAKILNGDLLSGNVTIESNDKEVVLNYNNGDKLIRVEKVYNPEHISLTNMLSAGLITSPYGIIIKDLNTNTVSLLTNNDSKSMEKFEAVKSLFKTFKSEIIFGTTVINTEKG